ncbi:MAG: RHS repeat protein, partial [Gemmataceae bacterium]|nr:RHS repeat protein [Gemmataceae bacterium]
TVQGVTADIRPNGTRLTVSDTGIVAPGGSAIRFAQDATGRLVSVLAPNGQQTSYSYTASGALENAAGANGQGSRYGYTPTGTLRLAVRDAGADVAVVGGAFVPVQVDLGGAAIFSGQTQTGTIAAGEVRRFAFRVSAEELASTPIGMLYLRAGDRVHPGIPDAARDHRVVEQHRRRPSRIGVRDQPAWQLLD